MNIIIADDDKLVSASLKIILTAAGINVVAVGSDAREAEELYAAHLPDAALLDIRMGEETGLDAAERILERFPDAKILFLTTFSDNEYIISALKIGAKGYILKQSYESIAPALLAVAEGQMVFGEEIVTRLPDLLSARGSAERQSTAAYGLSERETEIITLVADGLSNKEISAKLYLSEGTVRNYISGILDKLELRDRTQLAVFYYKMLR